MDKIFKEAHELLDNGYFGNGFIDTEEAKKETHALINKIENQVVIEYMIDIIKEKLYNKEAK